MMIEGKYYVYIWKTKYNGEVFYVGKGSGNRWKSMKNRNNHFKNIRKKYDCECEIVKYFNDEEDAYNYELELGEYYKSIGQARACHVLGNVNKYIDYETLTKMKKTCFKKEATPWNAGKKMSNEYKEACRKRMLGTKQSEETKKKRSASLKGHSVSEKTIKSLVKRRSKKCLKIDIENMSIVQEYGSLAEVARELNVSPSIITIICNKYPKEYKGYYWKRISQ